MSPESKTPYRVFRLLLPIIKLGRKSIRVMRKRYIYVSILALAILLTLVVWQVSFSFGEYGPANPAQTFVFWAVSTLIFLLTVTLSFMLFRTGVKLYLDRQSNREGSRIQTKLVLGGLALSLLPVVFFAAFGYVILNRTIGKWFRRRPKGCVRTWWKLRHRWITKCRIGRRRWQTGWRRSPQFARAPRISPGCATTIASRNCA